MAGQHTKFFSCYFMMYELLCKVLLLYTLNPLVEMENVSIANMWVALGCGSFIASFVRIHDLVSLSVWGSKKKEKKYSQVNAICWLLRMFAIVFFFF